MKSGRGKAAARNGGEGARPLVAGEVGVPAFPIPEPLRAEPHVFDLSSHARARDALAFGLRIGQLGFNIFVLGEDRSGRMTATLEALAEHARGLPRQFDWVYLNNFRRSHKPKPYRLPPGVGRRLRERMATLVPEMRKALGAVQSAQAATERLREEGDRVKRTLDADFSDLQAFARERGIVLERGEAGFSAKPLSGYGPDDLMQLPPETREVRARGYEEVRRRVEAFKARMRASEAALSGASATVKESLGEEAVRPLLDALEGEFGGYPGLARWLVELRADIAENLDLLAPGPGGDKASEIAAEIAAEERYAVNLLVDHGDDPHPQVVVEPSPTYENLFGTIEYRSLGGIAETDFTMIRAGALHRANGSILVLRAESVAQRGEEWAFLKAALRDGVIRIEELHRQGGMPMAGAPSPKPIPLSVKVVIVGAPRWYYTFFSADPDFTTYFKVKADIDPDMPANERNLGVYAGLIDATARRLSEEGCDRAAMQRLIGETSRWANDRRKLSARCEMVEDLIAEAAAIAADGKRARKARRITLDDVRRALDERRQRNARIEDRSHESLRDGVLMIDTVGARVGQINALTIRDLGDYEFGLPSRVTARVFVGRHGIVNIERSIEMGGPIQQKGVFIIGGYLNGRFARAYPLSFSATLTFEQSYGEVEGDSASMAELLAILSALADVPLRQDVAVTGSVNQNGDSQAVAGVSRKVEGFYRTCAERGLTGTQGVLIPRANEPNVILVEEVAEAIAAGRFHLWSMRNVDEALDLLTTVEAGEGARSRLGSAAIGARIEATLDRFDTIMRERASLWS